LLGRLRVAWVFGFAAAFGLTAALGVGAASLLRCAVAVAGSGFAAAGDDLVSVAASGSATPMVLDSTR